MANQQENTFKISQLDPVANLGNSDLFIMSDYEGNKFYTRKLTYGMLVDYLSRNPELISKIIADAELNSKIEQKVDDAVSAAMDIDVIDCGNASE